MQLFETRIPVGRAGRNYLRVFFLESASNSIQQFGTIPLYCTGRDVGQSKDLPYRNPWDRFAMSTSVGSAIGHKFPTWKTAVWSNM